MTKREAKETLERILRINGPINLSNYEEAIEVAIKALSSHSIPAPTFNLDAEIADYIENERYIPDDEVYIVKEIAEKFYELGLKEKSEIPTNLDEAAEEYAYTNWEDDDYHEGASEGLPFDAIGHTEKCFKAGAEWMAGQGLAVKGLLYGGNLGIPDTIPEQFYSDKEEEVIVQIRKKD